MFENISAIVFVADLSAYRRRYPLGSIYKTYMEHQIDQFDAICNSKWFALIPKILLLNKVDLFRAYLKETPLSAIYPNFHNGDEI